MSGPRVVAVHGVPLGPTTWSRLRIPNLEVVALRGLATPEPRHDWRPAAFADEVAERVDADTVLLGHDLGGLVAALVAVERPVRAVVLTGTALGPYWTLMRATALPGARRVFYHRWHGRRFLAGGVAGAERAAFVSIAEPTLARIPDLASRMEATARALRVPANLARALGEACPVHLVWGRFDRYYPLPLARHLARRTGGGLTVLDAGHYAMWEAPSRFDEALTSALSSNTG